ncbi:hypothetical protein J5X07_00055 [Actinomyces bowdenii]|uniref:LppM family (lipo)protein n=1 Tax=Actinomyces bowdenii TaxID=131109 RepID=UPI001ABCFFAF|nr:hypothetical protein [Actinomyces bowdenii]MBO3723436.1 hypothetical protein [Actinomyces bowdenii]
MRIHRSAQRMHDRPAWRRPLTWAAAVLALVLLPACGAEYDVVIHDDDTVDLTYTLWDSSGLEIITEETCTQEAMSSYSTPLPPGARATYTYTTHGEDPACQISGSAIPLSELDGQSGAWSVTHEEREYVFSLSPSALSQAGGVEAAAGMTATVSVTFPGEVSSANGEIDGSTVTWREVTSSSERLEARGNDGSGFPVVPTLVVILLVIAMIVLTAVSVMASRRRKRAERAALQGFLQDPPTAPGPAPALPQGQHQPAQSPPAVPGHSPAPPGQAGATIGPAQAALDEPYPQSPTPGYMLPTAPYQESPPGQAGTSPQPPHPYNDPRNATYRPPDIPTVDR